MKTGLVRWTAKKRYLNIVKGVLMTFWPRQEERDRNRYQHITPATHPEADCQEGGVNHAGWAFGKWKKSSSSISHLRRVWTVLSRLVELDQKLVGHKKNCRKIAHERVCNRWLRNKLGIDLCSTWKSSSSPKYYSLTWYRPAWTGRASLCWTGSDVRARCTAAAGGRSVPCQCRRDILPVPISLPAADRPWDCAYLNTKRRRVKRDKVRHFLCGMCPVIWALIREIIARKGIALICQFLRQLSFGHYLHKTNIP